MHVEHWPGPIPLPELDLPELELVDVRSLPHLLVQENTVDRRVLYSGETYLELGRVRLSDSRALLRFVDKYGPMYTPWRVDESPFFAQILTEETNHRLMLALATLGKERRYRRHYGEALISYRLGAAAIVDMTSAWRIWTGAQTVEDTEWALDPSDTPIRNRADAAAFLERTLDLGLEAFHPRLALLDDEPGSAQTDAPPAPHWERLGRRVGTFAVCCVELFNHIVEGAVYRKCENPSCQRPFVRQQGRAKHGQHRMHGQVKYCSRGCATSVAKRRYREKKKREAQEQ